MKNSQFNILKVASRLVRKYAGIDGNTIKPTIAQDLQSALINASSLSQSTGVMPFISMLKEDGATLNINVKRDGSTVSVSAPSVNPDTGRYTALPGQIKRYLEKNIEIFPGVLNDESVDYDDVTVTLHF
jgi:hypothetical protein